MRRWLGSIRAIGSHWRNPKVIKHFDVMYCIVVSCVGGEVTSPYEAPTVKSRDLRSGSVVRAGAGHHGYVLVSGVGIRVLKPEGERDVGEE